MIPMAFDYEVAESVDHAIELLGQHGDESKLLAGGHSLIPIMRLRLAAPTVLIDLGRLDNLRYVRDGGDHLAIGAMTPTATCSSTTSSRSTAASWAIPPVFWATRRSNTAALWAALWPTATPPATCRASSRRLKGS
jgi:hypothetical protein